MNISIMVLACVFVLIAVRQIGKVRLAIWQIMLAGAVAVLATGQISLPEAVASINVDVMLFLFGMFVVGEALEESGYLSQLTYRFFRNVKSRDHLVLAILFGMGLTSAFLMNDTMAIIGTPVVLLLAEKRHLAPKLALLALAFGITLGSVMSPIGNPQNLLIAVHGHVPHPFTTFFRHLFIPSLINLFLAYLLLKCFFRGHFEGELKHHTEAPVLHDKLLVSLSKSALILILVLVLVKIFIVNFAAQYDFPLPYIALIAAAPILISSPRRFEIVRKIDWATLVFFAAMFILMKSVWDSGFFQTLIQKFHVDIASIPVILGVSTVLSQFVSNVPMVALYVPMITHHGAPDLAEAMIALAAGATTSGNLSILGAASNIIIIHKAETEAGETLTFWEFTKVGLPLTLVNLLVYWIFLVIT